MRAPARRAPCPAVPGRDRPAGCRPRPRRAPAGATPASPGRHVSNGTQSSRRGAIALPPGPGQRRLDPPPTAPPTQRGPPFLGRRAPAALSVPIGEGNSRGARITAEPVIAVAASSPRRPRDRFGFSTGGSSSGSARSCPPTPRAPTPRVGASPPTARPFTSPPATAASRRSDAATGQPRWSQDLDAPGSSAPTILGDLVLLVSRDSTAWALEATTGRVRWTVPGLPPTATFAGGAAVAARGDVVILPTPRARCGRLPPGRTRALDQHRGGQPPGLGRRLCGNRYRGRPGPRGDTVYVGSVSGRTAALMLRPARRSGPSAKGAQSPVWPAGGSVFLVNDLGQLLRLRPPPAQ
jgi:hypothetical protein